MQNKSAASQLPAYCTSWFRLIGGKYLQHLITVGHWRINAADWSTVPPQDAVQHHQDTSQLSPSPHFYCAGDWVIPNFSLVFVGHWTDWIAGRKERMQQSLVGELMRNIITFLLHLWLDILCPWRPGRVFLKESMQPLMVIPHKHREGKLTHGNHERDHYLWHYWNFSYWIVLRQMKEEIISFSPSSLSHTARSSWFTINGFKHIPNCLVCL